MSDEHAAESGGGGGDGGDGARVIPISAERREFANVVLHYAAVVETMRSIERGFDRLGEDERRTLLLNCRDQLRETREASVDTEEFLFAAAMKDAP